MAYTHPVDRFMFRIRGALLIVAALSAPVFLGSYVVMMKWLYEAAPIWVSACVTVSHVIVWLGIAALADIRRERGQS